MKMKQEAGKTIQLAFPIILGEIVQIAIHLIDTAMVGAVSYKQLAAAALAFNVINIPFVIGIGMTIAVAQMVSLAHGKHDSQKVSHYFYNGFVICTVTALIIAGGIIGGKNVLYHLKQDPEVVALAVPFMVLISISIIPMLMFMALKQFADGLQFTKIPMYISLLALPFNAFINWLLVFGNWGFPRYELFGAAYGTIITRTLMFAALVFVLFYHKSFRKYVAIWHNQWKVSFKTIKEILQIGIPTSLQVGMESGAFAISGILIGMIGAAEQAAHQIALSCASFTYMVSLGLSQASSIRVSTASGQKDYSKIHTIGKSALITALMYGVFCAIFYTSLHQYLPVLFNDNALVVHLAGTLLIYAAIFQISDATQSVGAGLLRGIKDVKIPTVYIAIAYWVLGIPIGYYLCFDMGMGAVGMWLGFIIGLTVASVLLILRFFNLLKKAK